ncbi:MAG: alpha-amylase [[Chlorobium] sp. 445]|nr:MAG: alpha-amylase [[Chlorobium] sp. 445]
MSMAVYEFHLSRKARDTYQFSETFFTLRGDILFENFRAAQLFTEKLNAVRRAEGVPSSALARAADIYTMGLMHEIFHFVVRVYERDYNPEALQKCDNYLKVVLTTPALQTFLRQFSYDFPSQSVYRGVESVESYLQGKTDQTPNRSIVLEEVMLLFLENENPAFATIRDLIDDRELRATSLYESTVTQIDNFFETQPRFGPDNQSLFKLLYAPMLAAPNSIMGQLEFIFKNWQAILVGSPFLERILFAMDVIKEEGKYFKMLAEAAADKAKHPLEVRQVEFFGWGEKETPPVPTYREEGEAPEGFSPDLNWMPRLVLIAKNTYVWLDQLSKKYQRAMTRLDQIPEEELATLAARGFTGLWLIGIWERSVASKRIKHLNGNIDAVASAYSLYDYDIARDLGGEEALYTLRERARRYGIRLASDMVPNHTGIDSRWVIQHPDWFISTDYPPYPNYTFYGPDLSSDERVGIFIEDGYWRKTDAAVVFARLDRWTGDVRYIYHGNDGTNMPWNDTAQLNFLKAEVREAVIQTILHVARLFPIIRFDAAMVLTKQHIQRLWFPEPGKGGAIASRAAFAMTKEQFDALMPNEFWREVVDRVQAEAPDTLLLAEAFWLLEGYFVRTLGMHRVYNSAFMHMFKKEENDKYRTLIKNTLEYDARILKRYVNFMSNPDEETAVNQFGKDDKYFGVCVMMVTMPGLPMFAHGQIEGFSERYGMEYQRAYYNETPDEYLIARHEREIFPLLKRRYLFAEVDNFYLYDFITLENKVDENVFAFSNQYGNERALVIYHNKFATTRGWIRTSVAFLEEGQLTKRTLAEALHLSQKPNTYTIFRDFISGLEYIRANSELSEQGMYFELQAYKYAVFMEFREVVPTKLKPYDELARLLNGQGVPSIEDEVMHLSLRPVHQAIAEAICPDVLKELMQGWLYGKINSQAVLLFKEKLRAILQAKDTVENHVGDEKHFIDESANKYVALMMLANLERLSADEEKDWKQFFRQLLPREDHGDSAWRVLLIWLFVQHLDAVRQTAVDIQLNVVRDWRLEKFIVQSLTQSELDENRAHAETELIRLLVERERYTGETRDIKTALKGLLESHEADRFIGLNVFQGTEYFNKERFEMLVSALYALSAIEDLAATSSPPKLTTDLEDRFAKRFETLNQLVRDAERTGYRLKDFLKSLDISILEEIELPLTQESEESEKEKQVQDTAAPARRKTSTRTQTAKASTKKATKAKAAPAPTETKPKRGRQAKPELTTDSLQTNGADTSAEVVAPKKSTITQAKTTAQSTPTPAATEALRARTLKVSAKKTSKTPTPSATAAPKPSASERAKVAPKKSAKTPQGAQLLSPELKAKRASASGTKKKVAAVSAKKLLQTSSNKTVDEKRRSKTKKSK